MCERFMMQFSSKAAFLSTFWRHTWTRGCARKQRQPKTSLVALPLVFVFPCTTLLKKAAKMALFLENSA